MKFRISPDLSFKYSLNPTRLTNIDSFSQVELRKAQTELQATSDIPDLTKDVALSKDIKRDGKDGVKPAGGFMHMTTVKYKISEANLSIFMCNMVILSESSPVKVPDRPREDKWPRKTVASSSPSSSPIQPSVLQSMSESSQPSWMELAKRKSMAWSDKTMD